MKNKIGIFIIISYIFNVVMFILYFKYKNIEKEQQEIRMKLEKKRDVLVNIILNRNSQFSINDYLCKNGFEEIVLYGWGDVGRCIYSELNSAGIKPVYVVDKNSESIKEPGIKVLNPSEKLPNADVMLVTVPYYYDDVNMAIKEKFSGRIISVEDVIYNIQR